MSTYLELAKEKQKEAAHDIVLVQEGYHLRELYKDEKPEADPKYLTTADEDGMRTYERSVLMLFSKAVSDLAPGIVVYVKFPVDNGFYIELKGDIRPDDTLAQRIEDRMRELVSQDLPIEKEKIPVDDARAYFRTHGMPDRDLLFRYRRHSGVNLYRIEDYVDYYYGYMVPSTGYLKYFEIEQYDAGFVLLTPRTADPEHVPPFHPEPGVFNALQRSSDWSEVMDMDTVGKINEKIADGTFQDLILMAEARQEKEIAEIAERIAADPEKKCIMIAGPSSSGKTSFSHRLSVQLMGLGLTPHPVEVDNYFVSHARTPKDADGNYDFESIHAVDVELFNKDMLKLLAGERVKMPTYNFKLGKPEYKGNSLQLGPQDILVIEGIHCLNDELSYSIPAEKKFRIFISALTQTNIDEHNCIPSPDGRLIRRIVRDARSRGITAQETIARWPSVRNGEMNNIFPYEDRADAVFNSALVYEFSVLKTYAEQRLFGVPEDSEEFLEARRLLRFLDYFLGVDSAHVPQNSLLKEFIGGSIFNV